MTDQPAVAVAVVSWNTRELLGRCLDSLRPEVDLGRAEVWVVDNGSTDGSRELVREHYAWTELIESEENLGFGPAVNLVAQRTDTPWIAAANADIELHDGALEALLAAAERDPRAGSLAPRLITPDGATQHSVHSFPSVGLALAFNSGAAAVVPGLGDRLCLEGRWDPKRERPVDWAHGAFLLLRREAYDAAGGFDPGQWMYAEDLDIAWRLAAADHVTRYVPAARVRHEVSAATRQAFADERTARHVGAAYEWMARRRGVASARAYAAIHTAGAALRLAAFTALARLRPARYAARRDLEALYMRLHARGLRTNPDGEPASMSPRAR
jgi:N-acetylglucosaminyl-diphospho-decaprenol L-rhamnosyltransferase